MKILIVDDSVFLREKLIMALYEMDNTILTREEHTIDGGESAFYSFNPDLVILEIDLLPESGILLLRKIKESSSIAVVIIFTDHATEEIKSKYLEAGADYFFDKCKEYREMLEVIRNLVIHKKLNN